ncbi:sensor histidine kinase [Candidatus Izimaplasma bacterium ZiA1]|uniref:sensor histidine kinase n=1 Tax=Candidatus Izimoplasma sp. ZiA1 TaxID=2024899 RepID=UPI001438DB3B
MKSNNGYIVISYLFAIIVFLIFKDAVLVAFLLLLLLTYHLYDIYQLKQSFLKEIADTEGNLKISIQKEKQKRLENYSQFLSLSQTLGSGLIVVNDLGIIDFVNKDVKSYFIEVDYENHEYKTFSLIKPLYKFINESYLLESPLRKQIMYNDKYYDLVNTPIFEGRFFKGCLIIVHDITAIKTAEKFQKQFTADVSHELKTPLSVLKGFSEILDRDINMDSKQRVEFIGMIKKEVNRMETIITDLLTISKMDRLDYELKLEKQDITTVINDTINLVKSFAVEKNLKISHNLESCMLNIDATKLSLAFINLIKNAINYTDEGVIKIKGMIKEKNYIVKITDTGIGIDNSEVENIFKRFYRIDSNRSRETGGSGLGLSITKNVILRHEGTISVDSVLNKGTTFIISLPIKK